MLAKLAFAIGFALLIGACGSGNDTSAPCIAAQSDAGATNFGALDLAAGVPSETGRLLADACGEWNVVPGTGGSALELSGTDASGRAVVTLFWLEGYLDSWRAVAGWEGSFEGSIRIGQSIEEVRRLRPALAAARLTSGYLREQLDDVREVFFHFDINDRVSIIFVRGKIEGQWF